MASFAIPPWVSQRQVGSVWIAAVISPSCLWLEESLTPTHGIIHVCCLLLMVNVGGVLNLSGISHEACQVQDMSSREQCLHVGASDSLVFPRHSTYVQHSISDGILVNKRTAAVSCIGVSPSPLQHACTECAARPVFPAGRPLVIFMAPGLFSVRALVVSRDWQVHENLFHLVANLQQLNEGLGWEKA